MTFENKDRAERRREEKEQAKWNEAEWGKLQYRVFDKCPGCGCPARFTLEAMRGEMPDDSIRLKPPALFSFEFKYDTPLYRITIAVVGDSCCKCGMLYPVARSKTKVLLAALMPRGGDGQGMRRAG